MSLTDVAAALRKVAALRALCLKLPHIPTPAETRLLRQFDVLKASPERATEADVEALVAGWRQWWREGKTEALAEMGRMVPAGLIDRDRRLATLRLGAELAQRARA